VSLKGKKKSSSSSQRYYGLIAIGLFITFVAFLFPTGKAVLRKFPKGNLTVPGEDARGFGVSMPQGFSVYGIDVSRHQGKINWKKVRAPHGSDLYITFAFLKASEGATRKDEMFDRNWQLCRKYGILRGAYHFLRPNRSAEEQFNNFSNHVTLDPGDLPPVLDVEQRMGYTDDQLSALCSKWLKLAEEHYGVKPIIYTNRAYYKAFIKRDFGGKYPIWFAHYQPNTFSLEDDEWEFWQFSDRALIQGIEGGVDLNVYKGDSLDLYDLLVD
jgi:lysozyme